MLKAPLLLAFATAFVVSGCTTPEQMQQAQADRAKTACQSYGFEEGTPNFAQCVMQTVQTQQMQAQQAYAGMIAMSQQVSTPAPQAAPMMRNCTSRAVGGVVRTSCY